MLCLVIVIELLLCYCVLCLVIVIELLLCFCCVLCNLNGRVLLCEIPTRNIMQDLVKNLARIRQESGKNPARFLNVSYISFKILARILQEHSCKILLR